MNKNMQINGRDESISFVRLCAMIMIFLTHVFQYNNIELAWWFNVGVQIFLLISGLLYSRRRDIDILFFYKKNISKILCDYYVYLLFISLAVLWKDGVGAIKPLVKMILLADQMNGFGHFWFIPTIIFCYLITPLIWNFFDYLERVTFKKKIILLCFLFFGIEYICLFWIPFVGARINCYLVGMLLGRMGIVGKKNLMLRIVCVFSICINVIRVFIDMFVKENRNSLGVTIYTFFVNYTHLFLGILLFVVLAWTYKKLKTIFKLRSFNRLLCWSDEYSYDFYIVHHYFVMENIGSFFSDSIILQMLFALATTVISAYLLRKISKKVLWMIENKR